MLNPDCVSENCGAVQLVEDVEEEAKRYGAMQAVFVPQPPPTVTPDEPARVFIRSAGRFSDITA
jgi:hypothetical protein